MLGHISYTTLSSGSCKPIIEISHWLLVLSRFMPKVASGLFHGKLRLNVATLFYTMS